MDDPRKRCIQETIALCSSQGLDFTMSELAARLGMSKKTLYVLFESKEALLNASELELSQSLPKEVAHELYLRLHGHQEAD